jgi:hypothetical protein
MSIRASTVFLVALDPAVAFPLSPGMLFAGRYTVLSLLGAGGMGAVYRVRDGLLDEVVALKLATPALPSGGVVEAITPQHEVAYARRVTHPNVARVFDLGVHNGQLYITMELVPGTSVRDRLREGAFAIDQAVRIAHQIASALAAAHDANVLHLDLKPENVVVADGTPSRAVLVDFGVARALGATSQGVGSIEYMAPEQLDDGALDGSADVYALGLLLFEMLTGRCAFPPEGPVQARIVQRVRLDPPPLGADVPADLARLVAACVMRRRADRPSARNVEAALAGHLAGVVGKPRSPVPAQKRAGAPDLATLPDGAARRLVAARHLLMTRTNDERALADIDVVLAQSPELDLALALRALALTRIWYSSSSEAHDVADRAVAAVSVAVARGAQLADSHVADALVADYGGDVAYAVRALRRALAREPLHAFSHEVLGRIELEAGRGGEDRLLLAFDLDGAQAGALAVLARERLFAGRNDGADTLLRMVDEVIPDSNEAFALRARAALWSGDPQALRAARSRAAARAMPLRRTLSTLLAFRLGEAERTDADADMASVLAPRTAPKRRAFGHQLGAEAFAAVDPARALAHVVSAASLPLSDLRWMDACPALAPLRDTVAFADARAVVQRRVDLAFDQPSADARLEDAATVATPLFNARR